MSEDVLVVLPALNEETSVASVVERVQAAGYDACVVDDGSEDRTAERARNAGATVLRLPNNVGVGGALRCGFRYAVSAGYSTVVQVDADGQHDPFEVAELLRCMEASGADMVIGSRFVGGRSTFEVSLTRRIAMRLLAWRASVALGAPVTDASSGFRAIGPRLLERFAHDYPTEYLGDTVEALVIAGREGARVVEHPVEMEERQGGVASAGAIASAWYVLRVLLAIELMPANSRGWTPTVTEREAKDG